MAQNDNRPVNVILNELDARVAAAEAATPKPLPTWTVDPTIATDGSPAVGETLTLDVGVVANGSITSTKWMLGGVLKDSDLVYTPDAAGTYDVDLIATGPGGTATKRVSVTVASTALAVDPIAPTYADDLSGSGTVESRPNWTVLAGDEGKFVVGGGYLSQNQQYGPDRHAFFGPDMAAQDVEIGYIVTPDWDESRFRILLWYVDPSNFIEVSINTGGVINVRPFVDGQTVANLAPLRPTAGKPSGKILFRLDEKGLRVAWDGAWSNANGSDVFYPYDGLTHDEMKIPVANRHGRTAIRMQTWTYTILDSIAVSPLSIAIDAEDQVVGRDTVTATAGTATLTGRYVGAPSRWAVRVLDKTLTEVTGWSAPKAVTAANGGFSIDVQAPVGGPYYYQAAWIGADGKARITTSRPCMVARQFLYYGQSNSIYRAALRDVTKSDLAAVAVDPDFYAGSGAVPRGQWASAFTPYRPASAMGTALALQPLLGVPVGLTVGGQAATPLSGLIPGSGGWTRLLSQTAHIKGVIEAIVWDQGEGDADGAEFTANYYDVFRDTLVPALKTLAKNDQVKILIAAVGSYPDQDGLNGNSSSKLDSQRRAVRLAHQRAVDTIPNVSWASFKTGADHGNDSYHYSPAAYGDTLGRRDAQSIAKALGVTTFDGRGPVVTAATRSGATIRLTIDRNGADSVSGPVDASTYTGSRVAPPAGSFKGYEVSADDFATRLTISGIAVDGSDLVVTLAAAPSGAVKVRSMSGATYDDTSLFVGAYTGGITIPVAAINTPLIAA